MIFFIAHICNHIHTTLLSSASIELMIIDFVQILLSFYFSVYFFS